MRLSPVCISKGEAGETDGTKVDDWLSYLKTLPDTSGSDRLWHEKMYAVVAVDGETVKYHL